MDRKDIGRQLKAMRVDQFGSQQSYADFELRSGVSRGSVKNIEDGSSYPRLDILEKWLTACGTDLSTFFSTKPKSDREADLERKLAFIVRSGEEKIIDTIESNLKMGVNEIERVRRDRQRVPAPGRRGRQEKHRAAG